MWHNGVMKPTNQASEFRVNLSGFDKLMPDVDTQRVYESRLVHQLDRRKVIYCESSRQLYYWEPENGPLRGAIASALKSMHIECNDEPVPMDNKGVFNKPRKLLITDKPLLVVISALRLMGVTVEFNHVRKPGEQIA